MSQLAFATFVWIAAVYSSAVVGAQRTTDLMCFNCSHTYAPGVELGEMNCKDPFAMGGISIIKCETACVKHTIEGDVSSIQRNCYTNEEVPCEDLDRFQLEQGGFLSQDCCYRNLCNSGCAMTFNLLEFGAVVMVGLVVVKV